MTRTHTILGRAALVLAAAGTLSTGLTSTSMAADATTAQHRPAASTVRVAGTEVTKAGTLTIRESTTPGVLNSGTSTDCTGSGNPQVCLAISGTGSYVNSMENETRAGRAASTTLIITYEPTGHIYASATVTTVAGDWYDVIWTPNATVTPGPYCAGAIIGGVGTYSCQTVGS